MLLLIMSLVRTLFLAFFPVWLIELSLKCMSRPKNQNFIKLNFLNFKTLKSILLSTSLLDMHLVHRLKIEHWTLYSITYLNLMSSEVFRTQTQRCKNVIKNQCCQCNLIGFELMSFICLIPRLANMQCTHDNFYRPWLILMENVQQSLVFWRKKMFQWTL